MENYSFLFCFLVNVVRYIVNMGLDCSAREQQEPCVFILLDISSVDYSYQ